MVCSQFCTAASHWPMGVTSSVIKIFNTARLMHYLTDPHIVEYFFLAANVRIRSECVVPDVATIGGL